MPTLEELLADQLRATTPELAQALTRRIREELPSLFTVPTHEALARAGVEALLRDFELRLRFADEDGRAPTAAIAFARDHARRGTPLADVLRSYQVGQQATFDLVAATATGLDLPAEERTASLGRVARRAFAFADAVMVEVARAFEEERDRRVGHVLARREAVVRDLLAGRPTEPSAAEAALGYRLDGRHLALVVVADDGSAGPDLTALLRGGTSSPALVLGRRAWVRADGDRPPDLDGLRRAASAAGVRIAVGGPAPFARAYRQAETAAAVADLDPSAAVVPYREVALDALLLRDRGSAAAFAAEELGALADDAPSREVVRAWLHAGRDRSATAAALGVHRNTVARRLGRAERLLGRPLDGRARELDAALAIRAALPTDGPAVDRAAGG